MNPVLFAVVAALVLHSGYGCVVTIIDIKSKDSVFKVDRVDEPKPSYEITFVDDVADFTYGALFGKNDYLIEERYGQLCNYENNDVEGMVAQIIIKALGFEDCWEIPKGTWKVDRELKMSDDFCDKILKEITDVKLMSINVELNVDGKATVMISMSMLSGSK